MPLQHCHCELQYCKASRPGVDSNNELHHLGALGPTGCKDREAKGMQKGQPLYGAESEVGHEACLQDSFAALPL